MKGSEAERGIETGGIRQIGVFFCEPLEIEFDALNRPWLKVRKWLIHPDKAARENICNAEGIGFIPLF